jgi:hypothetical protein
MLAELCGAVEAAACGTQRETSMVHVDCCRAIRELMRAACPNTADDTADDTAADDTTPVAHQHPKLSHLTKHAVRDAVDSVAHTNLFRSSCFNNNAQLLMRVCGA